MKPVHVAERASSHGPAVKDEQPVKLSPLERLELLLSLIHI